MIPVSPVQVEIKPENSCNNWKCCFGWICCPKKKVEAIDKADSPISMESVEKITTTYERHHTHHTPEHKPRLLRKSSEVNDFSVVRLKANVDLGVLSPSSIEENKEEMKENLDEN